MLASGRNYLIQEHDYLALAEGQFAARRAGGDNSWPVVSYLPRPVHECAVHIHHNRAAMWRVCCFILCLVPASRQTSITEFAVPHAVQAGENAELHCTYELKPNESDKGLYVKWWWTPLNASTDHMHQLYQRIVGHAPMIIQSSMQLELLTNDSIRLLNMTPADSGIYECEVSNIDEARKHQELLVYSMGSGPKLNISAVDGTDGEENDVLVSCEASGVAPYPDITITVDGNLISNATENVEGPVEGLYDITTTIIITESVVDGSEIRCELFYKNDNISHPAYVDIETFNISGAELSTTEVPEIFNATDVVFDNLQNINGGKKLVMCMYLVLGLLLRQFFNAVSVCVM